MQETLNSETLAWVRREKAYNRRREELERSMHQAERTSCIAVVATEGGG